MSGEPQPLERPPVGDRSEHTLYTKTIAECLLTTDRVPYPVGEFPFEERR